MNLTGATSTGVANTVWTRTVRTLTTFGTTALVISHTVATTLAAAAAIDVRPAAGICRSTSMALTVPNTAGASGFIGMWDGTSPIAQINLTLNQGGVLSLSSGDSAVGGYIKNNGTQSDTYMIVNEDLVQ